jgi:hypothetical protein
MSFIDTVFHRLNSRTMRHGLALPRRNIFIWGAVILFINQLFNVIRGIQTVSLEEHILNLGAVGAFQYLAWYVIFRLLSSSGSLPAARSRDVLVTAVLCLLVFLPTSKMIWVAATGIAIYLWLFSAGDLKLRAAAIVLAALAVQEFWGHVFFKLVSFPLLRAETAVVGTILETTRPGTVWHDNLIIDPGGHGIAISTQCSSFHNLSLAMLCWVTVSKLWHEKWRARDFVIGATIGVTMILLNVARLSLMGWDVDLFHYWHEGTGGEIFAIGASLTVLLISLYCARPLRRLS